MQIDRRLIAHIDWLMVTVTILLALAGLATIYSATHVNNYYIYEKHMQWLVLGSFFFVVAVVFDYTLLDRFGYVVYGLSIVLLIAVLVVGPTIAGTNRWLSLGFITFQPSEISKLALVVALAKYFSTRKMPPKGMGLKELVRPVAILIVPFLLIAKEPDLGTALIYMLVFSTMVLVVGVRRRTLVGIVLGFAPLIPLGWSMLKGYQKARLLSFLNPSGDAMGAGYHVLQSKIAIGSGFIVGKGFTEGTQGTLRFLPEHHTDFVFAILAEEWGFIGSIVLLTLFFMLIHRGVMTAKSSKDRFGFLLALGISSIFFWHIVINMSMVSGLMPVVGMPLPFISYGGSFLVTSLIGVGLLANISMRRFIF